MSGISFFQQIINIINKKKWLGNALHVPMSTCAFIAMCVTEFDGQI
jgi:hypothetical protein